MNTLAYKYKGRALLKLNTYDPVNLKVNVLLTSTCSQTVPTVVVMRVSESSGSVIDTIAVVSVCPYTD